MKKALFFPVMVAFGALLTTGCNTYNTVGVTQADGVDFRKSFHTYMWLPDQSDTINTAYNNEIIRNNIRLAVDKELKARHLSPAAEDVKADLSLQLVVQNHDRAKDNTRFTPGFYFGPFGGSYSGDRTYYAHNRLTLNMYDRKTNRLVWTCTAEGDLNQPKDMEKNIQPAVSKIMKKYPVQPAPKPA